MAKKITLEYVKRQFELEGYQLLSIKYQNAFQKLDYICSKGHKHNISWNSWQQGHRCPFCVGLGKPTIEFIKSEFVKEGYQLLTKEYKDNKQKLEFICSNDHNHSISWSDWKKGNRCPYCSGYFRKTIEFIEIEFAKEGYRLLTTIYEGAHQKLDYICPKGHKHSISWTNWQQGQRCGRCNKYTLPSIEFIKTEFEKEGYVLLSKECTSSTQKLYCMCPDGYKYKVRWNSWQQGQRCPHCKRKKLSERRKQLWDTFEYRQRITEKIKQCWKDPIFQKKIRKACALKPNKPEQALSKLLQNLFPNEYKYVGDFQFFLGGKNPDFMNLNGKKFLIELYGDYWHRNDDPQERIDHFKKFGFNTLIIWEHELKDQELLKNKLQNFHKGSK